MTFQDNERFNKVWNSWSDADSFSGVFSVSCEQGIIFEKCCGFRNRSDNLPVNSDTAFGIASGTKMFTGLAVCKLIDDKKLSLTDRLWDVLPYDLGQIDKGVTIFHLLTHTSGIGDYIDEEAENCMEQLQSLYEKYPVYLWERLEYYLQMITPLPPKFEPGTRYGYSNAGFVMLGLVIEAISGIPYQQFVQETIIAPCRLDHTGYYRMDALPVNTAYGYIQDDDTELWRTNMFSMPIIGGSDGGLYTCAKDLDRIWRAVFSNVILSADTAQLFLKPQVDMGGEDEHNGYYGLGVYIKLTNDKNPIYFAVGGDFGVNFFTAYFPAKQIVASALANTELNNYPLLDALFSLAN